MKRLPGISLFALWLCVGPLNAVELVKDGQARAIVVLSDTPSPAAKMAEAIFSAQIERISGAKLTRVPEGRLSDLTVAADGTIRARFKSETPAGFVLIGDSKLAKQLGADTTGLTAGGFLIKTTPNAVILLGTDDTTPTDPDGSRYAVTTFLEEALGFRFLWPSELGLIAPERKTIEISALDKRVSPQILQRKIRSAGYSDRLQLGLDYLAIKKEEYDGVQAAAFGKSPVMPNWFEWQRLGGSLGLVGGHAYGEVWEKYHETHPEWFAMQPNGSRDQSKLTPERARLCKSNLALIDQLAKDKIAELDQNGGKGISLSPNDGGQATFCMCEECKKLDPPNGRPISLLDNSQGARTEFAYVSLTDRMVWFWNRLAERIAVKHPDAWLTVYAYSVYKAPPLREKLHPNLAVAFVGMDYKSDEARALAKQDWDAWSKMTRKLYWRPNLLLFARREGTPAVFVHKMAEDVRYFADHSLVGTDFDSCMHHWATEGLNVYVLSRLLWDPHADVDAMVNDYCQAGFGNASGEVRKYFDRVEALTNDIAKDGAEITAPYTPEVIDELNGILDAAFKQAGADEAVKKRIAFVRLGVEFADLQHRTHALRLAATLDEPGKAQLLKLQEKKWRLMRDIATNEPLSINTPMVAWGSEGAFRKFGWKGVPADRVDADEDGKVILPPK